MTIKPGQEELYLFAVADSYLKRAPVGHEPAVNTLKGTRLCFLYWNGILNGIS